MTNAQLIRDYINAHPGVSNAVIAKALKLPSKVVATQTGQMALRGKLTRKESEIKGGKLYLYYSPAAFTPSATAAVDTPKAAEPAEPAEPAIAKVTRITPEVAVKSLDAVVDELVEEMAETLAGALTERLKAKLTLKLREHLPDALPHLDLVAPTLHVEAPAKAHKMKVGITCLLPNQAGMIQQEFGDTFDLKFWNAKNGDGHRQLKALGDGCEVVFWNCGFSSQSDERLLRNTGVKVINFGGGMTQLRTLLTELYAQKAA